MCFINLDVLTLVMCLFFGNLFTLALLLAYRTRVTSDGSSELLAAGKVLQLLISLLLLLHEAVAIRYTLPLITLMGLAGMTAESFAIMKLLGIFAERMKKLYYGLAGTAAAILLPLALLYPLSPLYIAYAAFAAALLQIVPGYALGIRVRGTPLQKVMGLLYGAVVLLLLARVPEALGLPLPEESAGLLRDLSYLGVYLLMFLGTAGVMLLSREQSYAELERVATYDELTGILNRRAFNLRARPLIAASVKESQPYSFMLLDVDHFKEVNDTYGHDTGDKVLRDFARRIGEQLGNGDLFSRFGGEEFAVLLHRADEAASGRMAERLRRCVLNAQIEGVPLSYTMSIGVVTVTPGLRLPLNELYKLSDAALYQAKHLGRNCVVRGEVPPPGDNTQV
ncbi:GGDEF domain-containing protein ['Paenibacillus yunnanensis' Narsing Rao et al. 2020]|uniref:GGDEF domain-containing protein n=1 Tax=Paenibacillus tengchongensis TaxID=2608684 RepID=UPI00124CDC81|nr:GGDEF domain-containing protein [Paenibacillus tengchongensis]